MWRRLSSQFRTLSPLRSTAKSNRLSAAATSLFSSRSPLPAAFRPMVPLISRHFSTASGNVVKKVEDVMPIATGHEREELEAELQGRDILDINYPEGPFGTKEAPAVVKSYYDKRIVGCPGAEGEDEHDVVWFWLEKGKPHECPVCTQYFVLEVVGPGGPPDGHGDDDHHH
ncbi:Cytochrome c oxidase subunit 5b-1, mitochondrial [Datura stramonium]|uniref:Cytochrome c oxidase subunit 5b-1, mitochondrial n=1 Tax=Datura stramonium TaxID=4076 RepID=A0ABS8SLJ1_DATST|nr:Cytochrome c oxidase subunit 5b-1, mitochondrial [Datura stramonium]